MTRNALLRRNLVRDQRGAVMLIGLFMAVFLVALLYYVVGIGDATAQRERMQDGADAAAFSAAVLNARGMNTLALANMVMAALLAILVALKLTELLAAIAILLIAVLAFWAPGLAGYIPGLDELRRDVRAAHDELEPTIHAALETLHTLEHGIRVLAPAAAQLRAIEIVREHYHPPAELGLVLPPAQLTLPTEDGDFSEVCDKATGYVADLVGLTLSPFTPDSISDLVGDATADLASADSTWFCGDGGGKPPHTTLKLKTKLPTLPARSACSAYGRAANYQADEHAELCDRAELDEQASEPDDKTGTCLRDCDDDGLYAQRAALAREQCRPDGERRLVHFDWRQREVERSYVFRNGAWRVEHSEVVPHSTRRIDDDHPPCGPGPHAIGADWRLPRRAADEDEPHALCSNERMPIHSGFEGMFDGPKRFIEVVDLFGCVERKTLTREVDRDDSAADTSRQAEAPQRLVAGTELGQERFQTRALVLGQPPSQLAQRLITLATWRPPAPSVELGFASGARVAARTAYAQAEYYYAVEHPSADERAGYLWNMRWQARLRRFRLADRDDDSTSASSAAYPSADIDDAARYGVSAPASGPASNDLSEANELLIH